MTLLPFNLYRKQLSVMALSTGFVFFGCLLLVTPAFVKDVGWPNSYLPFFELLLLSIFFAIWAVTGRWKRSGLWSVIMSAGIWLRVYQLDSIWNILLLISFGIVWEYYWHLTKPTSVWLIKFAPLTVSFSHVIVKGICRYQNRLSIPKFRRTLPSL